MDKEVVLRIDGMVEQPLDLSLADLDALPESTRIHDVSRFQPKRQGDGVRFRALLDRARVHAGANYVTLHADRDDFHVSVHLEPLIEQGIVVYRLGPDYLGLENGGPIRFLIRDPSVCNTAELDECANVKYLSRIELTASRGRDTRPTTEDDHDALHRAQSQSAGEPGE